MGLNKACLEKRLYCIIQSAYSCLCSTSLIEYHNWVNYNNRSWCGFQFQKLEIPRPWHCLNLPCETVPYWKTKKHASTLDICPLSYHCLPRQWMWSLHKGGISVTEPFLKSVPGLGVVSMAFKIHHEFGEGIQTIDDPKYKHMCFIRGSPNSDRRAKET